VIGDSNELAAALEGTVLGGRPVEVFDIPLHRILERLRELTSRAEGGDTTV
jgi:hypothetical protein